MRCVAERTALLVRREVGVICAVVVVVVVVVVIIVIVIVVVTLLCPGTFVAVVQFHTVCW